MSAALRIAVIGAGNHSALHHGSALASLARSRPGELALAAVCDLDAGRASEYARQFGFAKTYTDYHAMLAAERLDGIVAVTPVAATVKVAQDLLPRGIPLVIEKPTGETAAEAAALLELARSHGARHMVSFNRRFIPAVTRAKEWIAAQGPGRAPRLVVGRMLRHARREKGFVTGTGIHLIDAVLFLLGAPRRVATVRAPSGTADRYLYNALLDFGAGVSAALVISPEVGAEEETIEIQGPGWTITVNTEACSVRVMDGGAQVMSWQVPADAEYAEKCGSLAETSSFLAALRGARFSPDLADSVLTMRTAEAIEAGGERAVEQVR